MITTLVVILGVLLILAGIPFYFIKMSESKGSGTSLDIGGKLKAYVPNYDYKHLGHAFGLFAVLFAVLWLTDHKLGWFSFMVRDGRTFAAFVITYLVFAPAFMQEKDKTKKTPAFKKSMVFITVMAVDFALIGISPADILKNPFNWSWVRANPQSITQMAPPQILRPAMWSIDGVAKQGIFEEIKVPIPPPGCKVEWSCQHGASVGVIHKKLPHGIIRSCEEAKNKPLDFGEVHDLRLTFMSTEPESWYNAGFVCN